MPAPTEPGCQRVDSQLNLAPVDYVLAGERREKASEKNILTRSLSIPPSHPVSPARPKVVAAPRVATFLLVEVPFHLEGRWGGPRQPDIKSLRSCRRATPFTYEWGRC
jgi:hypothetical protein